MSFLPELRHALILVVLSLIAASCAVESDTVEVTLTRAVLAPNNDAPPPTPLPDLETNDMGDVILERFITGSYKSSDCEFDDDGRILVNPDPALEEEEADPLPIQPECGWLSRPLHGSQGKEVELPVMVFKATGPNPAPDPIIYLHGGPSGGVLSYIEYYFEDTIEPFLEDRDVIIFDQRGTGLAKPDLRCDSPYQWFSAADEDPETFVPRTARVCAFDLQSDGIELDQFSRQLSADDVMVLARELGYEEFNLHGSSWGGILAYTVMQLHPEWVRSSVLDSPLSISTDITGSMPASFREAMLAVQANCDLSERCSARHGDIVARYINLFDELDSEPRQILIENFWPVMLTADELSYLMFGLLYSPDAIALLPDMLLDLENGDETLVEILASTFGWGWGIDFTFLTYMCTDMVPASSVEQIDAQQIGIEAFDRVDDAPDGRGHTAQSICERMKVQTPAAPAMREVIPTTPTIVFSGSMDPITSRSSGEEIVETIPNGTFVGFSDQTHGVTHIPCALSIALTFVDDPATEVDSSCALDENRPLFEFDEVAQTVAGS